MLELYEIIDKLEQKYDNWGILTKNTDSIRLDYVSEDQRAIIQHTEYHMFFEKDPRTNSWHYLQPSNDGKLDFERCEPINIPTINTQSVKYHFRQKRKGKCRNPYYK